MAERRPKRSGIAAPPEWAIAQSTLTPSGVRTRNETRSGRTHARTGVAERIDTRSAMCAPVTASATEDGAGVTVSALANAHDVDHGAVLSVTGAPPVAAAAGTAGSASGPYYGALRIRNSNSNSVDGTVADSSTAAAPAGPVYDVFQVL